MSSQTKRDIDQMQAYAVGGNEAMSLIVSKIQNLKSKQPSSNKKMFNGEIIGLIDWVRSTLDLIEPLARDGM